MVERFHEAANYVLVLQTLEMGFFANSGAPRALSVDAPIFSPFAQNGRRKKPEKNLLTFKNL